MVPGELKKGLEGTSITETRISSLSKQGGQLTYRGIDVEDLVEKGGYEETVYLLWFGELPTAAELSGFKDNLGDKRHVSKDTLELLGCGDEGSAAEDMLRSSTSALESLKTGDSSIERENVGLGEDHYHLVAKLPTLLARHYRLVNGKEPVPPDPTLDHTENILWMLHGERPPSELVEVFENVMILQAEHGLNAGTFSARLIAGASNDLVSSIVGAIGTMKGGIHGGANRGVADMLEEIGHPSGCRSYVQKKLEAGEPVMGFGHRVYEVIDPRAEVLKDYSKQASRKYGDPMMYSIPKRLEDLLAPKNICPNVDLYTPAIFRALCLPRSVYPSLFIISRVAGWIAHIQEEMERKASILSRLFPE